MKERVFKSFNCRRLTFLSLMVWCLKYFIL